MAERSRRDQLISRHLLWSANIRKLAKDHKGYGSAATFEDAINFILECCLYNEAREELKLRLVFLHELKIEVLLFGNDTLTEMQNLQIFKSVQLYIKRTKHFTHL
jgi:hypothetical protein